MGWGGVEWSGGRHAPAAWKGDRMAVDVTAAVAASMVLWEGGGLKRDFLGGGVEDAFALGWGDVL